MEHREVTLDDKYDLVEGKAYLTGIQALVRLPLDQKRLDLKAKLNTGGFISGYRGSPLGGYDQQLRAAQKWLDAHDIEFWEGLNEDLGATAVWGSQQLGLFQSDHVELFRALTCVSLPKPWSSDAKFPAHSAAESP